jgi:acetylornithine/succinyldiaminopimelate/putrescine aminotransferase
MPSNRELFLRYLAQTSPQPLLLEISKAEGIWLYGNNEEKYMDLISGIAVSNLGHRHPAVLDAVKNQAEKYMHLMVYGEVIQSPQVKLGEAISKTLPSSLDNIYLVNSGSEAVEGALKLSKRYTGRYELVSCFNAYHGSTHGALSVIGSEKMKRPFRPLLPGIRYIRFNEEKDLNVITDKTAAVIIEPVQGEAGVRIASEDFLLALRKRCSETGALLIFDEIQTGFGRTGKFWSFEHYNAEPDIIVTAKGMGGGMPIGAFISSKKIMSSLTNSPALGHITTFGGHPVSCAASLATLETINKKEFLKEVERKGDLFRKLLSHPEIKEVRGKGLFLALQLSSAEKVKEVTEKALAEKLLIDWFLFCPDSLRLAPPLTITDDEIRLAAEKIILSLES